MYFNKLNSIAAVWNHDYQNGSYYRPSAWPESCTKIQLSHRSYTSSPTLSDIEIRDNYTSRSMHGFSADNNPSYPYGLYQISLGYNALGSLEIIINLATNNISIYNYWFSSNYNLLNYSLKLYIGYNTTCAIQWNLDSTTPTHSWPERLKKCKTLHR